MLFIKWFSFLLFSSIVCADLEDYFKKVTDKSGVHSLRNVDFIYMINLDERPEKFALCRTELAVYDIHPYRFSAVNGWKLSVETLHALGVKYGPWMAGGKRATYYALESGNTPLDEPMETVGRAYFCYDMAPGAVGCVLSHLSILQNAYDSGYETIWIMEDDIEIVRDPHLVSEMIDKLDGLVGKEGWDILFTDKDTKNKKGEYVICCSYAWRPNFSPHQPFKCQEKEIISPELRKIGARFGSYSMIIRRSGMKKLLDFFKTHDLFLPYDMEYTLPPNIRLFTVLKDIVSTQPQAPTDNGAPNYKTN